MFDSGKYNPKKIRQTDELCISDLATTRKSQKGGNVMDATQGMIKRENPSK